MKLPPDNVGSRQLRGKVRRFLSGLAIGFRRGAHPQTGRRHLAKRKMILIWSLVWGGFMVIATTATDYWHKTWRFNVHNCAEIAVRLAIWLTCGYFLGLFMWRQAEQRSQQQSTKS